MDSTGLCAAVVVATNGFVLWGRRSAAAARARIFFPSGSELPQGSLAAGSDGLSPPPKGQDLPPGVWWNRPVREIVIFADHYQMTISLLIFADQGVLPDGWEDVEVEDTIDRFALRK